MTLLGWTLGCTGTGKPDPGTEWADTPALRDVDEAPVAAVRVVGPTGASEVARAVGWTTSGAPLVGAPGGDGVVLLARDGAPPVIGEVLATGGGGAGLGAGFASATDAPWIAVGSAGAREVRVGSAVDDGATWTAADTDDQVGRMVRFGDLDGDGVEELVVGAPGAAHYGTVHVVSGADVPVGGTLADATIALHADGWARDFGSAVELADVDADGALDILAGIPASSAVYAWSGPPAAAGREAAWVSAIDPELDGFGSSLSHQEDAAGGTLVVGAPGNPTLGLGIYALPLPPGMMDAGASLSLIGFATEYPSEAPDFGATVAFTDLNADGLADLVAGIPGIATVGVRLQRAATEGDNPEVPWHFDPAIFLHSEVPDRTGDSLAVGPDLDGDGWGEVLVGAPAGDAGAGYAWLVWSGAWSGG